MVRSPISTSCGCSMTNATARATDSGGSPNSSMFERIWARSAGSSIEPSSSVLTNPGEIDVVRIDAVGGLLAQRLHHGAHRILGRGVDAHVRDDLQAGGRHRRHEVAVPLTPEHRCGRRDSVQDAAHVDVDHRRPSRDVAVGQRSDLADAALETSTSSRPNSSTASATRRSTSSGRVTSVAPCQDPCAGATQFVGDGREALVRRAPSTSAAPADRAVARWPRRSRCWLR